MHIGNETKAALSQRPQDIRELLALIPDAFPQRAIRGDEDALHEVQGAEQAIINSWGDGATQGTGAGAPFWHISWYAEWWMLEGTVYLHRGQTPAFTPPGKLDRTSPLVLLHRSKNEVYYGEELIPLAARVIAHSLLYTALSSRPAPPDLD